MRLIHCLALGALLLAAPAIQAQTSSSDQEVKPSVFSKTFTFGATLSYVPLGFFDTKNVPNEVTDLSAALAKKFGGGATIGFSFKRRFGLDIDFLFRQMRFGVQTVDADGNTINATTHARYYDLPIMFRYNYFGASGFRSHLYAKAGLVMRKTANASVTRDVYDSDGNVTSTKQRPQIAHSNAKGAVAAAGMRFRDDFGILVTPEFRYTYWFAQPFNVAPVVSKRDQMEVSIGFSW
jgi:hypothetical protein